MKKLYSLFYFSVLLLFTINSAAQDRFVASDAWGFGFGFTYPMYVSIQEASLNTSEFYGGFFSIQRNFSEHLSLRLKGAYNHVAAQYYENYSQNNGEYVENNMITFDLDFLYYFNPCEPMTMFLIAGAGLNSNKPTNAVIYTLDANGQPIEIVSPLDGVSDVAAQFNIGAGVDIRLSDDWRLHCEGVYHTVGNSKIDGVETRTGNVSGFYGGSLFGGNSSDTWVNVDIGVLYYFSKGEPSKFCDLYTGKDEVDYNRIEDIVRKYQTMPTEVDYDRICEIVKVCMGPTMIEEEWVLIGVNFDFNKATLRPESYPILDNAASILLENPDANVEIVGHTDQVGSDKFNEEISLNRANAVKKYLVAKGVSANRLTTVGKGKKDLLFKESDPESRYYNRRVEFHVK